MSRPESPARAFRFRPDIAYRAVEAEYYFLSADSMFHAVTDPVGTCLLGLFDHGQSATLQDMVAAVTANFEVNAMSAQQDIAAFVQDLVTKGILEEVPDRKGDQR